MEKLNLKQFLNNIKLNQFNFELIWENCLEKLQGNPYDLVGDPRSMKLKGDTTDAARPIIWLYNIHALQTVFRFYKKYSE